MTTFDNRDKGFENKFARNEEMEFKSIARRNKLLGLWAAEKLGKTGSDAEQYAKDVVVADFEVIGDSDVVDKLLKDFAEAKLPLTAGDINREMAKLLPLARQQIYGEK